MLSILARHNIRITGTGARTIMLAHGFGTDQSTWYWQVQALSPHYRLILFDHVGASGSDLTAFTSTRYATLDDYARDVLEIYAALDLHDTIYIGHSMGAMIGILAAIREPERFRALIGIGASPCYLNDRSYIGGFTQADLDALYEAMQEDYASWATNFAALAMHNADRPMLGRAFAQTLRTLRPDIAQAVARVIFQSDYRLVLPKLTVPALFIQARHDIAVAPEVGPYLARMVPQAQLRVIAAEGHFPHVSAPETVNRVIQAYLADLDV